MTNQSYPIAPSRNQIQTTAQEIATKESRRLLESEPRPAFDLIGSNIVCTNEDAPAGQRNYEVIFTPKEGNYQSFDGRHWDNFPT